MRNIFNNIGISSRSKGQIEDNGLIDYIDIFSYDIVSNPGFNAAYILTEEERRRQIELERQKLKQERIEKINKLNNL